MKWGEKPNNNNKTTTTTITTITIITTITTTTKLKRGVRRQNSKADIKERLQGIYKQKEN